MVTSSNSTVVRRRLKGRRADIAEGLLQAAADVIVETGYDGLTLRQVARAAGVSTASAYNYFSSKEHLLAELYLRRLRALPLVSFYEEATLGECLAAALEPIALAVADEQALAAGVTTALLAHNPDVSTIRSEIGTIFLTRISGALNESAPRDTYVPFMLLFIGGLLTAGLGLLDYSSLTAVVANFANQCAESLQGTGNGRVEPRGTPG